MNLETLAASFAAVTAHPAFASLTPGQQLTAAMEIARDGAPLVDDMISRAAAPRRKPHRALASSNPLVQALRDWRRRTFDALPRRAGTTLKLYHILHNRSIEEIAVKRPATADDLRGIHGIGATKMAKYGDEILAVIRQHGNEGAIDESEYDEPTEEEIQADMKIMVQELRAAGGRMKYMAWLQNSKAGDAKLDAQHELLRSGRVQGDWTDRPARDGSSMVRLVPTKKKPPK